jgi:hypothetical protein
MWRQFWRRVDHVHPDCRIASHTEGEVRDMLRALERIYRPAFPELHVQQWTGSIYTWLTHPWLDPHKSGRVIMDHLMKLVTTALQWAYLRGERDVNPTHLAAAAEALTLRRDTIHLIDADGGNQDANARKEEPSAESNPTCGRPFSQKNLRSMFDAMALSPVFAFDHSAKLPKSVHLCIVMDNDPSYP